MQVDFLRLKVHLQDELAASFRMAAANEGDTIALVLDADVSPMLNSLVGMRWLADRGVTSVHKLDTTFRAGAGADVAAATAATVPQCECDAVVYMLRGSSASVIAMCRQVAAWIQKGVAEQMKRRRAFTCFFLPRVPIAQLRIVEAHGLHDRLQVAALELALLPLDDDLCSLERPDLFTDALLHGDRLKAAHAVAESLWLLQSVYGPLSRAHIMAKGRTAKKALGILLDLNRQTEMAGAAASGRDGDDDDDDDEEVPVSKISRVILIDRELDPLTPFMTQLTYEGMIDELIGIRTGFIEVDSSVLDTTAATAAPPPPSPPAAPAAPASSALASPLPPPPAPPALPAPTRQQYALSSDDELFALVRGKSFAEALDCLAAVAAHLKAQSRQRITAGQSVSQVRVDPIIRFRAPKGASNIRVEHPRQFTVFDENAKK